MNYFSLPIVLIFALLISTTTAFLRTDITNNGQRKVTSSISSVMLDDDESASPVKARSTLTRRVMSEAIPFLKCPPILAEYPEIPGNFGFDPLLFAKDYDDLLFYQEAEIKHARLAMLVCYAAIGYQGISIRFHLPIKLSSLFFRQLLDGRCQSYGIEIWPSCGIYQQ
jgi:hypothetical protein